MACNLFTRKTSQLFHSFFTPFLLLLAVFLSCDPESSGSGSAPPRFTLAPNKDRTTFTLTISEGVKTITEGEFSALTSIGRGAAKKDFDTQLTGKLGADPSTAVTEIILPSTLVSVGAYAFFEHKKVQGKFMIPKRVRTIGNKSFQSLGAEQSSLRIEFEEPSQLTAIGDEAFTLAYTDVLKLPKSLETIGTSAFYELKGLSATNTFTIPRNVKRIEPLAFMTFDTPKITGTLTIESPYLKQPSMSNNLFIFATRGATNFTTAIKLHKEVYDSYTATERNNIFGSGATYQDLDGNPH